MLRFEDILELMLKAEKTVPEGSLWIEMTHQLADMIRGAQSRLVAADIATLIGIGAVLARQGRREFEAGLTGQEIWSKIKIERTRCDDQDK